MTTATSPELDLEPLISASMKAPVAALTTGSVVLALSILFSITYDRMDLALVLVFPLSLSVLAAFFAFLKLARLKEKTTRHNEPECIIGSKKVLEDPGLGYRLEEHYNTELDPTISYIKAFVAPGAQTVWHRLKDNKHPVESRFYILAGSAHFDLLDPKSRRIYKFDIVRGDSILVPDSFWRKITNNDRTSDLEMMVICIPRWRRDAFEHHSGSEAELPS